MICWIWVHYHNFYSFVNPLTAPFGFAQGVLRLRSGGRLKNIPIMQFKIEVCVDTIESAITAQNAGADRVELCGSLPEGGITPGYGTIIFARENLSIGLHVIIRPRGGDFLYSDQEYEVMCRDIEMCRKAGIDGVVLGILKSPGEIDIERTSRLIDLARPMTVTFHRAFDLCNDPLKGLEDVIATGARRLLTSGQQNTAFEGMDLIARLVKLAGDRIIIMPGSGISESNITAIAGNTGALEYHFTGRKNIDSKMIFHKENISMGGIPGVPEFSRKVADPDTITGIINKLKMI
jgi:copper homeostasis protein